jgi:peroxiredoxin
VSDQQEAKLKVRIEGFKKLAVGTRAPDFEVAGSKGETVSLSSFKGKQLLLIFWSADCPHCRAILPELNNLYAQYRDKAEFVAVSVDEDEEQWRKALEEEKLQFINVAELKGWDGQMVQDYYVYATPTFLLIDPAGTIAAKPTGVGEIMDILGR